MGFAAAEKSQTVWWFGMAIAVGIFPAFWIAGLVFSRLTVNISSGMSIGSGIGLIAIMIRGHWLSVPSVALLILSTYLCADGQLRREGRR